MKELNLKDVLKNTDGLDKSWKVWYVSIVGRPNVWKSSFLNSLLWEKVSIVSKVPQTTRNKILAIYNDLDSQIIFFDTPWIHKSSKKINQNINDVAVKSLEDSDLILYFIDSSRNYGEEEKNLEHILSKVNIPFLKIYTKTDLKPKLEFPKSSNIFKISSKKKYGFSELINEIKKGLPFWPFLFSSDLYTKQDMYFRISENIREKIFLHTKDEIPHCVYVNVEELSEEKTKIWENLLKIVSYIYAETDTQKQILIWKNGSTIKTIWEKARIDLEWIFEKKIFLHIRVKVRKNWRKDSNLVKKILDF